MVLQKDPLIIAKFSSCSGLRQAFKLFANLDKQSGEVGKTLLFRFDHLSWGAGNKAFVAKFGFALGDFAFEAGDFLRETVAFGGEVDFNLEHQLEVADDGHGSDRAFVRTVHVLNVLDGLKAGEGMNVRGGFEALRFGTCDDERDALGGRKLHFAAQVAHGIDHGLDRVHAGFGFSIKADFVKGGVGLHHDGGFLIFGAGASQAVAVSMSPAAHFMIVGGLTLLSLALAPMAVSAALRIAES